MKLSKETTILLLLSRVRPESPVFRQAEALIGSDPDWEALMEAAVFHGTANFVYRNLPGLENIPKRILDKFRNISDDAVRCNILLAAEADRIIEGLNAGGIEVIALKGPATSEIIFGDIGTYPSGDIDILVRIGDIDETRHFLESEGYQLTDREFDDYREFFLRELYHLRFSNGRYVIEPHWNLFFRYFAAPPDFWWEESIAVSAAGKPYRFLSPEKNILYNSFRLFSKGFSHLRFLVMVAELIRHYQYEIDWEKMFAYARRFKFENALRVVLAMTARLLDAPVPERYLQMKGLRTNLFCRLTLPMLLSGAAPRPARKMMLIFLRDDLAGSLRVLLRRLFPSMGEIVSRYRLSERSAKAVFYYVFNPLFLFARRPRKI